jgi:hypothetical protein
MWNPIGQIEAMVEAPIRPLPLMSYGFAQKVSWVRLGRTLAVSLRLTVSPT